MHHSSIRLAAFVLVFIGRIALALASHPGTLPDSDERPGHEDPASLVPAFVTFDAANGQVPPSRPRAPAWWRTALDEMATATVMGMQGQVGDTQYWARGPVHHARRGHHGKAVLSLALRASLPLLGERMMRETGEDAMAPTRLGGIAGAALASTLDRLVLADREHSGAESEDGFQFAGATFLPTASFTPDGSFYIGIEGTF